MTNEQQVQVVIRFLPHSWEHMKVHFTHNTEIKTFDDAIRHLELEKNWMESSRPDTEAYVADVRAQKNQGSKHN